MHICLISNLYPPEIIGGAEKHAADDAKTLADRGHRVSVITTESQETGSYLSFTQERLSNRITVYRVAPLNMYAPIEHQDEPFWKKPIQHLIDLVNPHPALMIRRKVAELDPDIIHVHNYSGLSKMLFSALSTFDTPIIHTLHDYGSIDVDPSLFADGEVQEPGPAMRPYQALIRQVVEQYVDAIVAPSKFIIEKYHEYGVFTSIRCHHIPLGIKNNEAAVSVQTVPDDRLRLLFVGQLTDIKGVDILIDAVKQCDDPDISLHIVGKGPQRTVLEERAGEDDRITFHGFVSESTLEEQYELAHYSIVPSRWYDNSPMVIYESLSRGTPVIGADIGGIPELIEPGKTGHIFQAESVRSLSDTIVDIRQNRLEIDSSRLAEIGTELTLDRHVGSLEKVYLETLDD